MTTTGSIQDIVTRNMKIAMAVNDTNQQTLANELGISRSSVSQKMTHRVIWSLEDIEKAGRFFRISPARFLEPNGLLNNEWGRRGLNPGPADYESDALTD